MSTFVLVPGAWLGSWVWRKITPKLREMGHQVYDVTLTGMGDRVHLASPDLGMETAIQDVINVLEYEDLHDVVLVGHSFAGKVIAAVQDRIPGRIRMLLFMDAVIPEKKEGPQGGVNFFPEEVADMLRNEAKEHGEEWRLPLVDGTLVDLDDIQGEDRKWFLSKITKWPMKLIFDDISVGRNYFGCRKAYILCTNGGDDVDAIVKKGLDGEHRIVDSFHYPMISKPDDLIKAMLELTS